ncbi:hypothetical protein M3204_10315 [Mesobacillus subterraneus]|jgi:hypothetical protein|uniref:hypothetical protein n=1 Tax=Mesobacillus subterraneus TaxID=285983 RepID=UPI00203F88F9|nr:hypothetical protein [Mesobacillus subterraneus]MCM3664799.1 hypothetical protein [Mesobacillus subterraneus]MCM3681888.1 hypothetical protein [Mesobacillus subterraneus]
MAWLFIFILSILGFALIIDYKRKKNNNNPPHKTHPHAKPGDSSNYIMGDNKHSDSGM